MGIRAHLRNGRGKPGLVLSAADQVKVNQMNDKSTHEKWAPEFVGKPVMEKKAPDANNVTLKSAPDPSRELNATPPPPPADDDTPPPVVEENETEPTVEDEDSEKDTSKPDKSSKKRGRNRS